jgi:hypothetical protein
MALDPGASGDGREQDQPDSASGRAALQEVLDRFFADFDGVLPADTLAFAQGWK